MKFFIICAIVFLFSYPVMADQPEFYQNLSKDQKQKIKKIFQNTSPQQKQKIKKAFRTLKKRRSYHYNDSDQFVRVQGIITISFDSFHDIFSFKNYKPSLFIRGGSK